MTVFTGTGGNDVANASNGTLTGFTGGTVADLQDATGDVFNGNAGNDTIIGASGADTFNGGDGDDFITGRGGADSIDGGTGFDEIRYDLDAAVGGTAAVTVNLSTGVGTDGFGNTDTIVIGTVEAVRGTSQADSLTGSNRTDDSEQFSGLAGNDTINGLGGFDEVRYDRDAGNGGGSAVNVNLVTGFATDGFGNTDTLQNIEGARGTSQADTFLGNSANNQFRGLGGADTFDGGGGTDELRYDSDSSNGGNAGIIVNFTGAGVGTVRDGFGATDTFTSIEAIRGTALADTFNGNSGNDEFYGLAGNDTLNGGAGLDWAHYGRDAIYGGTGGVTVNLSTGTATDGFGNTDTLSGIENASGTAVADTFTGDANNNTFVGNGGNDTINGGNGYDVIQYSSETGTVALNVNLATGTSTDSFGNTDTLSNIEEVRGGTGNDTITGANADEALLGNAGADSITGGGGFDFMRGGTGNDVLNGSAGTGIHVDQSSGDIDTAAYDDTGIIQGIVANLATGVVTDGFGNTDTLIDIERLRGTSFADSMTGSSTANLRGEQFEGLAGNDTINGGAGFNRVTYQRDANNGGGAGVTVNLATGTATDGFGNTDTLTSIDGVIGTAVADTLTGNANNNQFRTLGGADTVDGGAGTGDTLDLFVNNLIGGIGATVNMTAGTALQIDGSTVTFSNIEHIEGSYRDDMITGNAVENNLSGSLGNDTIDGGNGDDTINGGAGADVLTGGLGNDWLSFVFDSTEPGMNALNAGQYASDGWLTQNWNWAGVNVNLATGVMSGLDGAVDTFSGFENVAGTYLNDTLTGDANANTFRGYAGNDTIDGGGGIDTVVYSRIGSRFGDLVLQNMLGDNPLNINVNLGANTAQDGNGGTDTLQNIENVVGGEGNDTITGSTVANDLRGGAGTDSISGADGADTLDGGAGSDTIAGGEGDDWILYDGADVAANVTGGNGTDTLWIIGSSTPTGFNLAAQGFERAQQEITDTTNQTWSTIVDVYSAAWQRITSDVRFDDGTRQIRNFDYLGNQSYSEYINQQLDAANPNSITKQFISFDDGTKQERFFDYLNNQSYTEYTNDYLDVANSGSVTRQVIFADAGTKQERFFDYLNNQSYVEYINDYADVANPNAVTRQVLFFDNGTKQERFFDYLNNQPAYSEYINFYNAAGQITRQVGFNDAGQQAWEYFY